ncbi:MAG TPA: S8 family peptidase [Acidimicrobiia bacterium]|nr:S8 family peptidase [Acidimicrobiia bacterium]
MALGLTAGPPVAQAEGSGDIVEDSYIVTLEQGNDPERDAPGLAREHGGRAGHIYKHALRGFSFEGSEEAAERLARHPKVRTVVPDRRVDAAAQSIPTGIRRIGGTSSSTASGDGTGSVNADIAILDTGIDAAHPDLNVVGGVNCSSGSSYTDGNGHGTHVAGTAAAKDNSDGVVGVAPGARLWAVRVLDNSGSGSWSSVICGIDWVTANAATIEVANMSLGGSGSESHCDDGGLREAICRSVLGAAVPYAVAAGNSGVNATNYVPATFPEVMTVSALADFNGAPGGGASPTCRSDQDDTLADFSNYGADVDLMAPGVCIQSTWMGGGYNTISGTSMATPHVAGATALYRADHGRVSPDAVKTALQSVGTLDWTGDRDTSNERLLNIGDSGTVAPPPPPSGIQLAASGYKIKGRQQVDLTWSGATTSTVTVYRNGSALRNTANDGSETDAIGTKGGGSWTYKICETGSTTACSNTAAVTF